MSQGVLSFQYEEDRADRGMTALSGLPVYLDLAQVVGLSQSIRRHLNVREGSQGWTDEQMIVSLVLLNLAGGECVDDLRVLESDDGFCRLLQRVELQGLRRKRGGSWRDVGVRRGVVRCHRHRQYSVIFLFSPAG